MIGTPDSDVVSGSLRSAQRIGLAHEMLDAAEIRRRFPPFTPQPGDRRFVRGARPASFFPEEAIHAHLEQAAAMARTCISTSALSIGTRARPATVEVRTTRGTLRGGASGSCTRRVGAVAVSDADWLPLEVEPQILYWFDPRRRRGAVRARSISDLHLGPRRRRAVLRISRPTRRRQGRVLRTGSAARCTPDAVDRVTPTKSGDA